MKTPSCHLTDAIVELCLEAPGDDVAPRHLRRCEACRRAALLARRSLDVWRRDRPAADEIAAARDRLALRSARVPAPRPPAWILGFALVLLGGGALAALRPWERARGQASDPAPLETPDAPEASTQGRRAATEIAAPRPADEPAPPAPDESAPPLASAATSSAPRAPREIVAVAGSAASAAPVATEAAPAASASSSWQEVAAAMRQGDKRAADDALTKLERAPDAATRDEARLARAELAIASGRSADAQAPLADLAAHGATPLVRRRAAELLAAH